MAENSGKNWTFEDYEKLKQAFALEKTLREICAELGRSPYGIIAKLEHLGLVTSRNRHYHKVDPDPWITWQGVSELTEQGEKE